MDLAKLVPGDPNFTGELLKIAERAARAGGAAARERFRKDHVVRRKSDGSEVSEADEAAQAAALEILDQARPEDALIAEEETQAVAAGDSETADGTAARRPAPANDRPCWIIDPLDGTRNYISGVPLYACTIAVMLGGYPIVGVTYDPEREELYSATRDGFFVDGVASAPRDLRISGATGGLLPPKPLAGIPSSLQGSAYNLLQSWRRRVVVRNLGCTALHLALVAAGHLQAALTSDTKLWDLAAGWLMVIATGGVMTRLDGSPLFPLDVSTYAGASIATLAASDAATHAQLWHLAHPTT